MFFRRLFPHLLRSFFRLIKRLLLVLIALILAYQFWLLGWVLFWKWENPASTRFMDIRRAELQANLSTNLPAKLATAHLQQQWVDYARISVHIKRALIASEDDLFMQHSGFDWDGIQKALNKNQRRGKIVAGGSTITQQLAKNLFLSAHKTPWRKIEEALITLMLESIWDKQRIFEVYLNVIEWGNGVFGIEAAAQYYYAKSAAELTPEQAARLAAMVPSPRFYDRQRHAPSLKNRAESILLRMPAAKIPSPNT